jgi:hypothetical protein
MEEIKANFRMNALPTYRTGTMLSAVAHVKQTMMSLAHINFSKCVATGSDCDGDVAMVKRGAMMQQITTGALHLSGS